MQTGETGYDRGGLVGAGIVLHRAGAQRVERGVDALVLAREVGVVPDHGRLVHLGEAWLLLAERRLEKDGLRLFHLHVGSRERVASAALAAFVPDQVKGHRQPPPRRRRVRLWSFSPSPRRASLRPRDPALRLYRPPAKPHRLGPRRATRPRTPTGKAHQGNGASSRLHPASLPDNGPSRWRARPLRAAPPVPSGPCRRSRPGPSAPGWYRCWSWPSRA